VYKIFKLDYNIIENARESSYYLERTLSTQTHGTLALKDTNHTEHTNKHQNS
jgi:hypothetical protein